MHNAFVNAEISGGISVSTKTSVCLIGGHKLLRAGLETLLEQANFDISAEFSDQKSLLRFRQIAPDQELGIAIIILSTSELNCIYQAREIIETLDQETPVIILSESTSKSEVYAAIRMGTKAFLNLNADFEDLSKAIRTTAEGKVYLSPEVAAVLVNDVSEAYNPHNSLAANLTGSKLSKRENEIVHLLCEGLSSKEIARKLHLSAKTVENHRYKIYKKCQVDSITALMRFAIQKGLVSI